jgi:TRAP transporter 4TM/12TM fusion protein
VSETTAESTDSESTPIGTGERVLRGAIYAIGVALTAYTLYYAYSIPYVQVRHANLFLGVGLALFYLYELLQHTYGTEDTAAYADRLADRGGPATMVDRARSTLGRFDGLLCLISAAAAIGATAYIELNFDRLQFDAPVLGYTQTDILIGFVIVLLVIDATRRAYGWAITSVVLASIAYALAGPVLPGFLGHTGMTLAEVARYGAVGLTGTYGFILEIGTTWVAIFIMFAGMAKAFGALDYILDLGGQFGNRLRSGVVHVAVIASMAMGSITGSAAANTATTGSFTIPMMQRQGVRDDFAAAIESVASSGGQMMPPVMGVAAFLMADILQVPYVRIIQAGLLPALLFYFSVGIAVQFVVLKFGWTTERTTGFDRSLLWQGAHFAVPLAVLIYTLVVLRLTPLSAGLYTSIVLIATAAVRNLLVEDASLDTLVSTGKQTLSGFRQGALDIVPLVGVLASMGVIVSMLTQTGLAQKISLRMVSLAGGILIAVLLMAMLLSILFGLGMPTPAAYILVVILVAPGLVEIGIPQLTAHLFVFYFAMLSAITPPVAVAVAVGSRIAGANFMQTGKQALRIGAPGFLIPYALIANPELIFWSFPMTLAVAFVVFAGVVALVAATVGYDGHDDLGLGYRTGYLLLGAGAMYAPSLPVQLGAAALVLVGLGLAQLGRVPRIARSTGE